MDKRKSCVVIAFLLHTFFFTLFICDSFGQHIQPAISYVLKASEGSSVSRLRLMTDTHEQTNYDTTRAGNTVQRSLSCNDWLLIPGEPSNVTIGDLDIPGTQLTVEATINRTAPYTRADLYAGDIVTKHTDPFDANYILRPSSAEITTTNGYFKTPVICTVELNKTYHVALVYNGVALKFYRNGFLMSQIAATGNLYQNDWPAIIGLFAGTSTVEGFIGYINEVRIWNVARTQDEIKTYMNTSLPSTAQTGLQAYYVFNSLQNKQGNASWNGVLNSNAKINQTNPTCSSFVIDSCGLLPACRFQTVNILDSLAACRTLAFRSQATASTGSISNYQWDFGDGVLLSGYPVTHNYKTSGTYTVKLVVSSSAGCKDSISKQVTVTGVTASAGSDTIICQNQSVTLKGGNNASSYAWSPAKFLNDSTLSSPVATISSNTRFFLTVKGALGCTDTSSVLIAVRPNPVFSAVADYKVCNGQSVTLNIQNGDEFLWTPSTYLSSSTVRNPLSSPLTSTQYSAQVKEHTCNTDSTILINVTVNPLPVVVASSSNNIDCTNFSSQLNGTGASIYHWSPSLGLSDTTIKNPVAIIGASTVYTVKGIDTNGCSASDTVAVQVSRTGSSVYELPSAFTPNGDGHNDCFGITKWHSLMQVEFSIFNRFGQRIYFSNSTTACWDGRYKGVLQDAGKYVYTVKATSACATISRKGIVLLLR